MSDWDDYLQRVRDERRLTAIARERESVLRSGRADPALDNKPRLQELAASEQAVFDGARRRFLAREAAISDQDRQVMSNRR